ncbi:MAG: CHASE domain-containing protein [Chloroflexota bacterium]
MATGSRSTRPHRNDPVARRTGVVGLVLVAGTVLIALATAVGFLLVEESDATDLRARLHADNTDAADAFGQLTTGAGIAPAAIAGLFVSIGAANVSDSAFSEFTAPLLDTEAVNALEWIPRVAAAGKTSHEAGRAAVHPGYTIRQFVADGTFEPATGRPEYFPVAFVEPLDPNRKALGVDLSSETTRNAALQRSRDSGDYAATAPIKLAQGGLGMLVYYPAYDPAIGHADLEGRRTALLGFGVTVLRPAILLERATDGDQFAYLDVALYDLGPVSEVSAAPGTLIASHGPHVAGGGRPPAVGDGTGVQDAVQFEFGGRRLAMVAAPGAGYTSGQPASGSALLVAGSLAVLLLVAYAFLRRRTDRALRASAARLRSVVDASPDAFLGLDATGRVLDSTPQALALLGVDAPYLLGRSLDTLLVLEPPVEDGGEDEAAGDDEDSSRAVAWWMPAGDPGDTIHLEGSVERPDGEIRSVEVTMAAGLATSEWPVACFVRDVTEQRRAREERARAGRLEALGQLAAGVAHDFRNTLWGIDLVVGSLRTNEPTRESISRDADIIGDAVVRGNTLAAQLLEFARTRPPTGGAIAVGAVVRELGSMLEHLLGQHRALTVVILDDTSPAVIDRGQLQTVLINLIANARDAMPDGGSVRIDVERIELAVTDADDLEITPGDYVMVVVHDTGTGMPPSVASRIFEPYFTTKEVGKGTGLGLATAFGTIRAANGAITVESHVGAGTTFRILLPVDDPFDPSAH